MSQKRIYFAADERLLGALSEHLRKAGLSVETFTRQSDLVPALKIDPPDALLLGARMADGTALGVLQALGGPPPPTLVVLAPAQLAARADLFRAGVEDIAVSPIRPRLLATRMAELAGGARRTEPRETVSVPVRVISGTREFAGRTVDLSREGLGLRLDESVTKGSVLEVRLATVENKPFTIFGRVLHVRPEPRSVVVGIRLLGLSVDEEAALVALARESAWEETGGNAPATNTVVPPPPPPETAPPPVRARPVELDPSLPPAPAAEQTPPSPALPAERTPPPPPSPSPVVSPPAMNEPDALDMVGAPDTTGERASDANDAASSDPQPVEEPRRGGKGEAGPSSASAESSPLAAQPASEEKPGASAVEPQGRDDRAASEATVEAKSVSATEVKSEPKAEAPGDAEKPGASAVEPQGPESRSTTEAPAEAKSDAAPDAKAEPKSDVAPEAKAGPKPDAGPDANSEPKPETPADAEKPGASAVEPQGPDARSTAEATAEPKPESTPEANAEQKPEAPAAAEKPGASAVEPQGPESQAAASTEAKPDAKTDSAPDAKAEPKPEATAAEEKPGASAAEPQGQESRPATDAAPAPAAEPKPDAPPEPAPEAKAEPKPEAAAGAEKPGASAVEPQGPDSRPAADATSTDATATATDATTAPTAPTAEPRPDAPPLGDTNQSVRDLFGAANVTWPRLVVDVQDLREPLLEGVRRVIARKLDGPTTDDLGARAIDFARQMAAFDRAAFEPALPKDPSADPRPTTDPQRKALDASVSSLLRDGATLRFRAWLVEREGRQYLTARNAGGPDVTVDDDHVTVLVRELDAWTRTMGKATDAAAAAGDLQLLREVNASVSAANRAGSDLRDLAQKLRVETRHAATPVAAGPAVVEPAVAAPAAPVAPTSRRGPALAIAGLVLVAAGVNGWMWWNKPADAPVAAPLVGLLSVKVADAMGVARASPAFGATIPTDVALLSYARGHGLRQLTVLGENDSLLALVDVPSGRVIRPGAPAVVEATPGAPDTDADAGTPTPDADGGLATTLDPAIPPAQALPVVTPDAPKPATVVQPTPAPKPTPAPPPAGTVKAGTTKPTPTPKPTAPAAGPGAATPTTGTR